MKHILPALIVATVVTANLIAVSHTLAEETRPTKGVAISGVVTYVVDPAKPWRYSRYFIKNRKTGQLAETIVALRGSSLKDWPVAAKPRTTEIDQRDFQFTPQTVAIRVGDSVKFLNNDATSHNVRSSSPLATFSDNISPGFDFTHRFDRAGGVAQPIQLGCAFHGGMQAWILVFDHPFFKVTGVDGRFRFEGVPPGKYKLDVYHPAGNLRRSSTLELKPQKSTKLPIQLSPKYRLK